MPDILIVEDAKFFRTVLKSQIESLPGANVVAVETYGETVAQVTERAKPFDLALLDLNLPDAPDGEVVDFVTGMHVPSIIFSGTFTEETRDLLERQHVIDYVLKDSPASLNYVVNIIQRYFKNKSCCALIVDDSRVALKHMESLLRKFNFNVVSATNGQEALKIFSETPDIRLVICDYNMPDMRGDEVCKRIRAQKNRDAVCFIGISAYGSHAISAQFLKAGASDFLVKPFLAEEFFCRINVNMDALDRVYELDRLVHKDLVSGLHNRRYLEEQYGKICERARTRQRTLMCALYEINDFRAFNDEFGSDAGDFVLLELGRILEEQFDEDATLVVRYGGTQFCVLRSGENAQTFLNQAETIHHALIHKKFDFPAKSISLSISGAVYAMEAEKEPDILAQTKLALIQAKKTQQGQFFRAT